jgi:hypothetical protein
MLSSVHYIVHVIITRLQLHFLDAGLAQGQKRRSNRTTPRINIVKTLPPQHPFSPAPSSLIRYSMLVFLLAKQDVHLSTSHTLVSEGRRVIPARSVLRTCLSGISYKLPSVIPHEPYGQFAHT